MLSLPTSRLPVFRLLALFSPTDLLYAQISSEVRVKVFSDETLLNGEVYAYLTVPPPESPLLLPLPPLLPLCIRILIGRLPPSSDAATKAATVDSVAAEAPDLHRRAALHIGQCIPLLGMEVLYYGSTYNTYPGPSLAYLRRNQIAFFSLGGVKKTRSGSSSGKEE